MMILTMVQNFLKKFGEMKLEDAKVLQNIFKSNLNETSKGRLNKTRKKVHWKILNGFTNYGKLLLKINNSTCLRRLQMYILCIEKEKLLKKYTTM